MAKVHYQHTFEALVFWDILVRKPKPDATPLKDARLSMARIEILDAIEERFPEVKDD
jgi:hypothetical protein